jgi:hypothetical protein
MAAQRRLEVMAQTVVVVAVAVLVQIILIEQAATAALA